MPFTIRPITEDEVPRFLERLVRVFGGDIDEPENAWQRFLTNIDVARTVCAFDGDELIGTCAALSFEVTVPGGRMLPMGGTTMVTVQPTHRRRGALRAMMTAHLEEVRQRGEPLAGLWASESSIYNRYGFGPAAEGAELKIDARSVRFLTERPDGRVRPIDLEEAKQLLPSIYEQVRPLHPGMLSRPPGWWETRHFDDPKDRRGGKSARRWVVSDGNSGDGPEGYAVYRQRAEIVPLPNGDVEIIEVMASTLRAHDALWRLLTTIDLFPNVRHWNAPVDDELPWRITEPRRIQRSIADSLWIRVMDIPQALAGRLCGGPGRLVLAVRDEFLPDNTGRYALEADESGAARCQRTTDDPDLTLTAGTLGALYLGGHRPTALARAGLIEGEADALGRADRMFAASRLPWCPEVF